MSENKGQPKGEAIIYNVEVETATLGNITASFLSADLTDTDGKEVTLVLPLRHESDQDELSED